MKAIKTQPFIYDLLIIGGGIQGAGIARDAAMRGLQVLLCEKQDFASGTSSNSSKLIHGGLRYLERLEWRLVHQSLRERETLLRIAPHLVHPLTFHLPIYRQGRRPKWLYQLALKIYDMLAGKSSLPKHRFLNLHEASVHLPHLKQEGLLTVAEYTDAQMHDARLVLANIQDAIAAGADCFNYTRLKKIQPLTSGGFEATIQQGENELQVQSRFCVNASGPWVDQVAHLIAPDHKMQIKAAKGVHLVFRIPAPLHSALLLEVPNEERVFFVMPWQGQMLIGTTDTEYQGNLEMLAADQADLRYLWHHSHHYLTSHFTDTAQFMGTMAGVRPLRYQAGKNSRDLSRDYQLRENPKNFWHVIGGKYTIYRRLAEELCDRLAPGSQCRTDITDLYGKPQLISNFSDYVADESRKLSALHKIQIDVSQYLLREYGKHASQVLALTLKQPELKRRLQPGMPVIAAQVVYGIRHEFVRQLDDFFLRRTHLGYGKDQGQGALKAVSDLFAAELGWDAATIKTQCERYRQHVEEEMQTYVQAMVAGN